MKETNNQQKKSISSGMISSQNRKDRIKQIDALYRSQIAQIYNENQNIQGQINKQYKIQKPQSVVQYKHSYSNLLKKSPQSVKNSVKSFQLEERKFQLQTVSLNNKIKSPSKYQQKVRASIYLQGESTKTIQILKKQNQAKQIKIRDLSQKIETLLEKLKGKISESEYQKEIQSLKDYNALKVQRFQSLFKIRNKELFFKIKLQIINLLQEFEVPKQDLKMIDEIDNENNLFLFMSKKLKQCLRYFRAKQHQNKFQMQKDKILNEKYQERIHYLTQTNQMMKLTESKLKQKNQNLKVQLNQFINKLKQRQLIIQEKESQNFKLKRQIQQCQSQNTKITLKQKKTFVQLDEERRMFQLKQKQYKSLLSDYFLQIKQLQQSNQEKDGEIQQRQIKIKYLQQQIERLTKQITKSKQKYQWIQKEKQELYKDFQQQKMNLIQQFQKYKSNNNTSIMLGFKNQTELTLKKLEDYQNNYNKILRELQSEKKIAQLKNQQYQNIIEKIQQEWLQKFKKLQKIKQEETIELTTEFQNKQSNIRKQFERKQKIFAEELQAKMKNLLAQKDKKMTQKLIEHQNQNQDLKYEVENLRKMLALVNQSSKASFSSSLYM